MVPQTLVALVLAGRAVLPGGWDRWTEPPSRPDAAVSEARYEAVTREVTNWRFEAMDALQPKPVVALAALLNAGRPVVTRCVRLNNYWCIKSARWNGELATDSEGHVGFASAGHGAEAAATLLRRYYLDFKRRSALDIVRRWAPAECGIAATSFGGMAVMAVKGIGGTLRARYLASKRRGGSVRYTAPAGPRGKPGRVSMVLSIKTPQYRVPDIAEGMGERKKPAELPTPRAVRAAKPAAPSAVAPRRSAPAATVASAAKPAAPRPEAASACAPDEQRLRNYATRLVEGLGLGPTDDLHLFDADGTPLPNLARVMLAMSGFELGMLRADPDLVERAIERVAAKAREGSRADLSPETASTAR
jgi:hypothetical protein